MEKKNKRTWISLLLVAVLVIMSGCQAVNGLELNKVIQNALSVKSAEAAETISLELIPNPAVPPVDEEKRILELFSNVSLKLTDVKQEDYTRLSAKGVFEYSKGQIPFQMTVTDQDYTIMIEGAKKPIVIPNSGGGIQQSQELSKEMQDLVKQAYQKFYEWYPSLGSYLAGNLPNPQTISVTNADEFVHSQGVTGKKIHAEIKGSELIELSKGFLTNLLADEKALKEILGQAYDLFTPLVKQSITETGDADSEMNNMILPYLNNKTLAVEVAFTFITSNLKQALQSYDETVKNLESLPQGESLSTLLNDKQYLKTDILVDGDLRPRKTNTEIMFTLPEETMRTIKAFKLTMTSELWNINKPVKADVIDTSAGKIELSAVNNSSKLLGALDSKSRLYDLLKNDLMLSKKEVNLLMDNYSGFDESTKPYYRNDAIMVPARFVVEQLDADVVWNEADKQVVVTDALSGTVIKLNIGSKQASVNGMIKPLEAEAELKDGTTFVPVRFIAENMGAKVGWNSSQQMVTITRD
jgi:hypothetical protein